MGDIIWGTLITVFITIIVLINRISKQPDTERLIRNLIGAGSLLGLVVSFTQDGVARAIGILLFYFQFASIIFISINKKKPGYFILITTLLLQIPIFQFKSLSYRSQTLFGFNIQQFPGKWFDVEPGSYVSYFNGTYLMDDYRLFPFGINLISLILFIYFIRRRIMAKRSTTADNRFVQKQL